MRNPESGAISALLGDRRSTRAARRFGRCVAAVFATLLFGASGVAQPAEARSLRYQLDIPSEGLNDALQTLALASGHRLLYSSELLIGKRSPALRGSFTTEQAVKALLSGSNLDYEVTTDGFVLIRADAQAVASKTLLSMRAVNRPDLRLADNSTQQSRTPAGSHPVDRNSTTDYPVLASDPTGAKLDEIIVTSQKRPEKLQEVPVSVQVIGGPALQQQNYNNLGDVLQTVPGVATTDTGGESNTLFIRGIGSGNNSSFDQSVATFYDDIFHGRSRTSGATFLDLDRIEVLKGPQSTFFGNNAIAGALNIVTKRPGDTFDGWGRVLYGQFGQYAVEGAVGGPITDTFGARVAITRSGGSGWIDNVALNDHIPTVNDEAARLTLAFHPNHELDATLRIEGSQHRAVGSPFSEANQAGNCPPPTPFVPSDILVCPQLLALRAAGVQVPTGLDNNLTSSIAGQGNWLSTAESALTVNYDHWGQKFTSVTGFYNYHFNTRYAVPEPESLYNSQVPERYNQFSQEVRVASPAGGPWEYLAGAYFQTDQLNFSYDANLAYLGLVSPDQIVGIHNDDAQKEHTYSVFGSVGWNVTDRLKFSGGLRGIWDTKRYIANAFTGITDQISGYGGVVAQPDVFGAPTALNGAGSWHDWMPSARVQYQFTPRAMTYFSFSQGWKAGGFNGFNPTNNPADVPYGPEHVTAYELGMKSQWLDDTVLLDLAVFRSSYSDLQVGVDVNSAECPAGCNVVRNAASSVTQGVELEAQWVVSHAFQVSANVSYVDAHYVSYPNGSPTNLAQLLVQNSADLSGTRIPGTPRWSGNIIATYSTRLPGNYKFIAQALPFFSSSYYQNYLGQFEGAYTRLDARLALETPDGRWGMDLIGKNLSDRIIAAPPQINLIAAAKQEPRNVAVQVRYKF